MKKSILKRTVFGVFLVLLVTMAFTAPAVATVVDDEYIGCGCCADHCVECSDWCWYDTPEDGCPCNPPSSSDSPARAITPMYFYVNMPDGYDGRVLTIALNGLPLPAEKKAIAAIEMDITKPMNEGGVAEVIARIPAFVLNGLDVDPSHFALYHLVDGEWVKMDVTISYAKDGDLLIETTATSFGVFVVVVETA